jgi:two-component system sensor histidine kinase/response regulator
MGIPNPLPLDEARPNTREISRRDQEFRSLLDLLGGDREVLSEVVELFLQECPYLMGNICQAVTARDGALVYHYAHTLRTCVVILAFPAGSDLLLQLEAVRESGDFSVCTETTLQELRRQMQTLLKDLASIDSPALPCWRAPGRIAS